MFVVVGEHVFALLRTLGGDGSTCSHHMRDARFTIPTPSLLARVVEMTAPASRDVIVDPACGTSGFLVAAGEYPRRHHPEVLREESLREHFHHAMFHGFDFDATLLRIGSMNMLLHGVENPDIRYRDSLAQDHAEDAGRYTLVLAKPPFAGALDAGTVARDLTGIVSLPSAVFRPYAGFSTVILLFTRTDSGGTDGVWFCDMQADGLSLDDKRTPLLAETKLGAVPVERWTTGSTRRTICLTRWHAGGSATGPSGSGRAQQRASWC